MENTVIVSGASETLLASWFPVAVSANPAKVNGDFERWNTDTSRPFHHQPPHSMFRNIRYYRLDSPWPEGEAELSECLSNAAFEPCGPLTERSSGWMPIDPDSGDMLARRVNGADLLRLRSQSRVLPAAAVNEDLENRIEDFRRRMQEAPSPREKRRLKAEARDELLPKALLKSDKIWGFVDLKEKLGRHRYHARYRCRKIPAPPAGGV